MDLRYTAEEDAFRAEARAWLEANVPGAPLPSFDTEAGFARHREWERTLWEGRWSAVSWPEEYGGRGADYIHWLIFEEEYYRAGAPQRVTQNGIFLLAPTIFEFGTDEQRDRILPKMASGEETWCQGWSEPNAGSDPGAMQTFARRDGDDWVIDGAKRWIGLASIADVAVIWAQTDEGVRGFLVEASAPGFTATPIEPKLSMRASIQCDISLEDVRLPESAMLPKAKGLRGPFECLNEARYGIIWGAMGAARDSYEAALNYSKERLQFGKPLSGYQLTQQKLVNMALEINKGMLLALQVGRLKDAGTLEPYQISVGKLNNCREAIQICRDARAMLGGNGITLEYPVIRHANNLESVLTYEGTHEVHTLVVGQALTGENAFR